jgi:dienelactone hydrolase
MMHATGVDRSHMRSRALAAARRGYVVVTPDARAHGGFLEGAAHPRTAYTDALVVAFRARGATHPFLLDTVWDLQRVLDWLARRPDVDPGRVGATGVSLGGMQAWLLAAADARVAAAAPLIGVQSFRYAADNDAWQARAASIQPVFDAAAADEGKAKPDAATFRHVLDVLTPGLLTDYDAPQSVPTIAPRPFLAVNGELDPRCPLAGVRAAMDRAAAAYERAGARDAVQLVVVPGVGHEVVPSMDDAVAAWLDRWLLRKGGGGTR